MTCIDGYKKAFAAVAKNSWKLIGLFALNYLMEAALKRVLGNIPYLYYPVLFLVQLGSANLYLKALAYKDLHPKDLFIAFNNDFLRYIGGMAWQFLWNFLWGWVPVMGTIKYYEYRFTSYILVTHPELKVRDALKLSMQMTQGKKGQMFLADLMGGGVIWVTFFAIMLLLFPVTLIACISIAIIPPLVIVLYLLLYVVIIGVTVPLSIIATAQTYLTELCIASFYNEEEAQRLIAEGQFELVTKAE